MQNVSKRVLHLAYWLTSDLLTFDFHTCVQNRSSKLISLHLPVCVCVCSCVCVYTHIHNAHTHLYTHTHTHTQAYTHTSTHNHMHTYICMHIYIQDVYLNAHTQKERTPHEPPAPQETPSPQKTPSTIRTPWSRQFLVFPVSVSKAARAPQTRVKSLRKPYPIPLSAPPTARALHDQGPHTTPGLRIGGALMQQLRFIIALSAER
jgi:hypothetical protein